MKIAPGLEQQAMLAILRQHPDAYGVSIRDEITQQTKHAFSIGAVYAALGRLEEGGMITSRQGQAETRRGGRRKMLFTVTGKGRHALQASLQQLDALRDITPEMGVLIG